MKVIITLSGSGGELDNKTVENEAAVHADDMDEQIHDVIAGWTLSAGDTITIKDVS